MTFTILMAFVAIGQAQESKLSQEKREEFEAQKVAFFTQALDLTPTEAAVFWPLYNEMFKKMREAESAHHAHTKAMRKNKALTDADARRFVEKSLDHEAKMLELKKEYYGKMLETIPAKKVAKLDDAERRFHMKLLDRMCKPSNSPHK